MVVASGAVILIYLRLVRSFACNNRSLIFLRNQISKPSHRHGIVLQKQRTGFYEVTVWVSQERTKGSFIEFEDT